MKIDQIRAIVSSDRDTKHLKDLNEIDLNTAYQYIIMRDLNKMDGFIPVLKESPYLSIEYVMTKQRKEELLNRRLQENLSTFDSDIYLQEANLTDFAQSDEYRQKAVIKVQEFFAVYPKHYKKGLYIYGPYRTGKSYLLSAIASELTKLKKKVVFVYMPDLVRTIMSNMSDGQLEQRINILKRCDVLMLDDLGGEYLTAWFRDEVLLPILQYRLSASLPVFISSNNSHAQLAKFLSDGKSEVDIAKAARIMVRIRDLTTPVNLVNKFS